MYTSDTKRNDTRVCPLCLHYALGNLLFAMFCALFGAVYEHFSFGVYSYYMIYAFAPPLIAGVLLVWLGLGGFGSRTEGAVQTWKLLTASAVTFAVGCLATGVVKIYGTENRLLTVYPMAGGILLILALIRGLTGT